MGDTIKAPSGMGEYLKRLTLVGLLPLITSCMHLGIMGESTGHHSQEGSLFEKEMIVGGIRVKAIIPDLEVGRSSDLTVELSDDSSGRPLSYAKVRLSAVQDGESVPRDAGGSLTFVETRITGQYSGRYEPIRPGQLLLSFYVTEFEGAGIDSLIVVEARRMVGERMDDHSDRMRGGINPYLIVGGIIMTAMMVAMIVGLN